MTMPREAALQVLRGCEWLRGEPAALIEDLMTHGRLLHLNGGEWAQTEGDEHRGLVVVMSGVVHVSCQAAGNRNVLIGHCEAGAVLGHATRFSGGPRLVTAVCAEPSVLLAVSERGLEDVAARWPTLWRALALSAYSYTRRTVRALAELIALPPRQRLASRLLIMGVPAAARVRDGGRAPEPAGDRGDDRCDAQDRERTPGRLRARAADQGQL